MTENVKEDLMKSLKHMEELLERKTSGLPHADDIVSREEYEKTVKSHVDAGEKLQKQDQEIAGLKSAIQVLQSGERTEEKSVDLSIDHLKAYMRQDQKAMAEIETKASQMGVYSGEAGGYTVPKILSAQIIKRVFETSPIRTVASIDTVSSDSVEYVLDDQEASASWVSETETRTNTNTPDVAMRKIAVHELFAEPLITKRLLDDSSYSIEGWISEKVSEKFGRAENTAFVNGNGVGRPRGLLDYDAGSSTYNREQIEQINMGHATQLTGDGFINVQGALESENLQSGAVWLMKRTTYNAALSLMYSDNKFNALTVNSINGERLSLLGKQVVLCHDIPAVSANALAVIYGDFRNGYKILDRQGIQLLRDPYTKRGFVKFSFSKRVGGDVLNTQAIKIGKIAA